MIVSTLNRPPTLAVALGLAELGFRVFPCVPDTKRPATPRGCLDATTDPAQIERWWAQWPNANLAIETSGLFVLDVDGSDNPWLVDQPERYVDLAAGVLSRTPRGGRHYIFRCPAGKQLRNTAGKLAPNVDTRAAGGYILIAPSVVDGKRYEWPNGALDCSPDQLAEPPAWLVEALEGPGGSSASIRSDVAQPANQIPAGQRNSTLASLGGSMRRVGMGRNEILAALRVVNVERCRPPLEDSEVEAIADSVSRYEPDQVAVAMVEGHWSQAPPDAEPASDAVDPGSTPASLLHVPGFIGDLTEHIIQTAPYPERSLAFCGALATQSFLASRKVRDRSGSRSNLYLLGLAKAGAGKDWPRKIVRQLLKAVNLDDCIGDSLASGESVEEFLCARPSVLLLADEFHALLAAIKSGKDPRWEGVATVLLKMFTSADSSYTMRAKANRLPMSIDQPALTMFATSIPEEFYAAMSPRMLSNGLFSRMLILQAGSRAKGKDSIECPIPDSIRQNAEWWASFWPGEKPRNNLAAVHPTPFVIPTSAAAASIMADLRADADRRYAAAEDKSDAAGLAVWTRCHEKARRLALNFACSADHQNLEITEAAATWAADFAKHQSEKMLFMAGSHVVESEFDGKCKRALEALRRWRERKGDEWMPAWQLTRKLRGLSPREQRDVRETLLAEGAMERSDIAHTGAGRPGEAFRIR